MRAAIACLLAATLAIPASAQSDVSPEVREFLEANAFEYLIDACVMVEAR